jgi:stage V sporulation protein D (sporulation-specific penicillin-binding protein)
MEGVVSSRGTAPAASLAQYQVAGKTGTAEKLVDGHYSTSDYNASFVGFVPSRDPEFTILVVIDSPHGPNGYFGGTVSAPIFKHIADAALRLAGVRPTVEPAPPVVIADEPPMLPPVPARVSVTPTFASVGGRPLMPDLSGIGARDATRILSGLGLSVRVSGSGFVAAQSPEPGAPIESGALAVIALDRGRSDRNSRGPR